MEIQYLPAGNCDDDDNDNSALPLDDWIMNSAAQQLVYFGKPPRVAPQASYQRAVIFGPYAKNVLDKIG